MTNNLHRASREWFRRPNDERFISLEDLRNAVLARKHESWTATPNVKAIEPTVVQGADGNEQLMVKVFDPTRGDNVLLEPTHFAFGQLAQYAGAPASYLRKLPDTLAGICLAYGLERLAMRDDTLMLAQSNGTHKLRAMTSTSYGRIWDLDVVDAVIKANASGQWKIPASSQAARNPKRATTLYASDRDVFIFLVDEAHPIEVNGETLFRGFMTWNSEVGAATFGLTTFLYRYVCDNRIIWGATDVRELRIRHTGGAPQRFAYEGAKFLSRYAEESTVKTVKQISAAQAFELPQAAKRENVVEWLQKKGFTKSVANAAVTSAEVEEGEARSLWQIINGVTAHARTLAHTDARVELETKAGSLMNLVSGQ
jgi:hypothetical protein